MASTPSTPATPLLRRSRVSVTSADPLAEAPPSSPPRTAVSLQSEAVAYCTAFLPRGAVSTSRVPLSDLLCDPPPPPLWLALHVSVQYVLPALLARYQLPLPRAVGVSGHVAHPPLLASLCVPAVLDVPEFVLIVAAGHDVLVTCCSHVHHVPQYDALAVEQGVRVACVADAVQRVVVQICQHLMTASRRNLDQLDVLEARVALMATQPDAVAHSVWKIRRKAATLRRVHHRVKSLIEATECHAHTSPARVYSGQSAELLASVREGAHSLLEVLLAVQNNRMQETMQTLAVVTTMFVPLTFLAGIEGMNFRYMPELGGRWSYGAFWALVVVLVLLQLAFFRKKRWI